MSFMLILGGRSSLYPEDSGSVFICRARSCLPPFCVCKMMCIVSYSMHSVRKWTIAIF